MFQFILSRILFGLALLALPLASQAASPVGEWTTYGNGPTHTGYYPRMVGTAPFSLAWEKPYGGTITPAVLSGGRVYTSILRNDVVGGTRVVALSAEDGTEAWSYPMVALSRLNPLTLADGKLYFQTYTVPSSYVWKLDAAGGTLDWRVPYKSQFGTHHAPVVVNGELYANGGQYGGLINHHTDSGAAGFFEQLPQQDGWTPAYADGVLYTCVNGMLKAHDATTGQVLWNIQLQSNSTWFEGHTPVIAGGNIIIRGPDRLHVVNILSRQLLWSAPGFFTGTPAVASGTIYVLADDQVQSFDLATGAVGMAYQAVRTVMFQPLVTNDLMMVANNTSTFIFERATGTLQQTLPVGGHLSYAAGRLAIASPRTKSLSLYTVETAEADAATDPLPPAPAPQTRANPQVFLDPSSGPWQNYHRVGQIVYFIFTSPAKVERYDLSTGTWLTPFSLPAKPTAIAATSTALYITFRDRISAFSLDGTQETPLAQLPFISTRLWVANDILVASDTGGNELVAVDRLSGRTLAALELYSGYTGFSISPRTAKLFGVDYEVRPPDIHFLSLAPEALFGAIGSSHYGEDFFSGYKTFLFGNEERIATNYGVVFSTTDLKYQGSLGGQFDDADLTGARLVLRRGNVLFAYDENLHETGRKDLGYAPDLLFVEGDGVHVFLRQHGRGVEARRTPLSALVMPALEPVGDATNRHYEPAGVELGTGEIVYLLDAEQRAVYRWSVAERRYLSGIRLREKPLTMAYAAATNRLYLGYTSGRISKIELNAATPAEEEFTCVPGIPAAMVGVDDKLLVSEYSLSWTKHFTFSRDGQLIDWDKLRQATWELVWEPQQRKVYHLTEASNPMNLVAEKILADGRLGEINGSPYHGDFLLFGPIRLSPDGVELLLGNGLLYETDGLTVKGFLPIAPWDATWMRTGWVTLGLPENDEPAKVQRWNAQQELVAEEYVSGAPLRIFTLQEGGLVVSNWGNGVHFHRISDALERVETSPNNPTDGLEILTGTASGISVNSATLKGTALLYTQSGKVYFEYGASQTFLTKTPGSIFSASGQAQPFTSTLSALSGNTLYYYRAVVDAPGGPVYGRFRTFRTAPLAPRVENFISREITLTTADLWATIVPNGADTEVSIDLSEFPLGSTTSAPLKTVLGSALFDAVNLKPTGLQPGTTYYWRVVAQNSVGRTVSPVFTFTTLSPAALGLSTGPALTRSSDAAILSGTTIPAAGNTKAWFEYGVDLVTEHTSGTKFLAVGELPQTVQLPVQNLQANTTYQYRLVVQSAETYRGEIRTFTTRSALLQAVNDRLYVTKRKPVQFDPLANDLQGDREFLTITALGAPSFGRLGQHADGTLIYTPSAQFKGTDAFTYTVRDFAGHESTATVQVAGSFGEAVGTYHTALGNSSALLGEVGDLKLTLNAAGAFTGTLNTSRGRLPFRGSLDAESRAQLHLDPRGSNTTLELQLDVAALQLQGELHAGSIQVPFAVKRALRDPVRLRELAGQYTAHFYSYNRPDTHGFAAVTARRTGVLLLAGRTSAGQAFTYSSTLSLEETFPLFILTGRQKDQSLHGTFTLPGPTTEGTVSEAGWASATEGANPMECDFSRYLAPAGSDLPMPYEARSENGALTFGPFSNTNYPPLAVTLEKARLTASVPRLLSGFKLNRTTGVFSGIYSPSGQRTPFYGVLLQKQGRGVGIAQALGSTAWLRLSHAAWLQNENGSYYEPVPLVGKESE